MGDGLSPEEMTDEWIAEADVAEADVLVAFTVDLQECTSDQPMEYLGHNIKAEIFLIDDASRQGIGGLQAELFNVVDLAWTGELYAAYDSRSAQLTEAFTKLYRSRPFG